VTEFWKITHMVTPETIGIFDFHGTGNSRKSFPNISESLLVILGHFDLLNTQMGKNSVLNATLKD